MDKFPSRERASAATAEPRVSAVVVACAVDASSPARSALDLCLRSALAEPWIDELIVVDQNNAPEISSAFRALQLDRRDVKVIPALPGGGGAVSANRGAAAARGRWLLFLDADVVLQRGGVARMAAAGGEARAPWVVGGRLTRLDGRERNLARPGALNAFSSIAVALGVGAKPPRPRRNLAAGAAGATRVGAVSSAFMLIPRGDFEMLGGFDEGFLGEAADLDLCRRATDAGGSILFQPEATGVQFERFHGRGRKRVQGLARFAVKSAKTPAEKAFAAIAGPLLALTMGLRDFVAGQPPRRR